MFEKFQNRTEEKSGFSLKDKALKVINDTAKIATLVSLFSMPLNNEVSASNKNEKDPVNLKNKIELAQESIKKINVILEEKCKGSIQHLGGQEIKSFKLTKGTEVVSADHNDWFMLMDKDGSLVFFDDNSDGSVDRFIINNEKEENGKDLLLDATYALGDMEFYAKWGQITSSASMKEMEKDVKISSLDLKNKRVTCVDVKSGKSGIIEGEEAVSLLEKIQTAYTSKLEDIANGVNKNESDSSLSNSLDKKEEVPESKPSSVGNQPEKQSENTPAVEKSDYHTTFEDFKKAKESDFDSFKKSQEEDFNKFKEGK
ncbi:MAG TPA: hypothetical protein VIK86_05010 [Candidatus Paceibacterota bacterium]